MQKSLQAGAGDGTANGLCNWVRDSLRKIVAREFKPKGPRKDAVFYLLDVLKMFKGKSLQEAFL